MFLLNKINFNFQILNLPLNKFSDKFANFQKSPSVLKNIRDIRKD
jgi:hypothetical protein